MIVRSVAATILAILINNGVHRASEIFFAIPRTTSRGIRIEVRNVAIILTSLIDWRDLAPGGYSKPSTVTLRNTRRRGGTDSISTWYISTTSTTTTTVSRTII